MSEPNGAEALHRLKEFFDTLTALMPCDPDKNNTCAKHNCYRKGGPCSETTHTEFERKDDEN